MGNLSQTECRLHFLTDRLRTEVLFQHIGVILESFIETWMRKTVTNAWNNAEILGESLMKQTTWRFYKTLVPVTSSMYPSSHKPNTVAIDVWSRNSPFPAYLQEVMHIIGKSSKRAGNCITKTDVKPKQTNVSLLKSDLSQASRVWCTAPSVSRLAEKNTWSEVQEATVS